VTATAEQLLLHALGRDGDDSVTAETLLSELAGDDPAAALMAKLLLEGGASEPDRATLAAETDLGELEELRERNEALAAALGACFACWGTDIFCTHCGGEGRPGAATPEPRLFRQLVAPAVARFGDRGDATPTEGGQSE
jgi:hypothetical protein